MKRLLVAVLVAAFFMLAIAGAAQALTIRNVPTATYEGQTFTTPVRVLNSWDVMFKNCTFERGLTIQGGGGSAVVESTIVGPLTVARSIDYALYQVKVSGNVVLGGQNYSTYGLWIYPRGNLTVGGSVAFLSMTNMERGRVIVNGAHIFFDGISVRLPDSSRLSLFSGRGRDVIVDSFVTWGGYSLVGRIGPDWSFRHGYHHGARMTLRGPVAYPWSYPIEPEGTFGPGM